LFAEDFAKIASGENFVLRDLQDIDIVILKGKYLFDRFGFVFAWAVVGAFANCLPNIANPVDLFNDMYHEMQNSGSQIKISSTPEINITTQESINFVPACIHNKKSPYDC
jgi:hypothetical protein